MTNVSVEANNVDQDQTVPIGSSLMFNYLLHTLTLCCIQKTNQEINVTAREDSYIQFIAVEFSFWCLSIICK